MALAPSPAPNAPRELDELTLARAKRGEAGAQRALVERYQRPVFSLLSRMVGNERQDLVEDLAQETFLRVFRALPDFRIGGEAKPSTWILTIATRLAIDAHRARARRPEELSARLPEVAGPHAGDAFARRRELDVLLRRALGDLPEGQRAAFVLFTDHQLTHDEIARALDVDVGTVKSRLSRARESLRNALSEVRP